MVGHGWREEQHRHPWVEAGLLDGPSWLGQSEACCPGPERDPSERRLACTRICSDLLVLAEHLYLVLQQVVCTWSDSCFLKR